MKNKSNKQLSFFCFDKNKNYFKKLTLLPFLLAVMGIFLLPNTAYLSEINSENIIKLTNEERIKLGLDSLTANQLLTKAAYEKAESLFENQTFEHDIDGRKFSSWVADAGYDYSYVGENLALDFVTAEGTMRAWMDSPSHKKNISNGIFKEIGVAVVEGNFEGKNSILTVQIFGTPIKDGEAVPITNTVSIDQDNSPQTASLFSKLSIDFFSSLNIIFYLNTIFLLLLNIIFANIRFKQNKGQVLV